MKVVRRSGLGPVDLAHVPVARHVAVQPARHEVDVPAALADPAHAHPA